MKIKASPLSCLFALCMLGFCFDAGAQVPRLLNYQGRVTVGTANFEGNGQFKFALVNTNGTITFWSNDGTSAGGSQPAAAVTLPVAKGLYSVLLGDTALANMTGLPAVAFTNPDVRLRVWFNDGANGSQLLTPDQRLAPAAYLADGAATSGVIGAGAVTSGKIAPGAVSGTNIAPASLTSGNFAVPGPPVNGQVLGYNNGGLTWTAPGGGVFSLNGTSAYYNGGNVGIGSTAPVGKLEVVGQDALRLVGDKPFLTLLDSTTGFARSRIQGVNGTFVFGTEDYLNLSNPSAFVFIDRAGKVGVGSSTPQSKLEVVGQDALRLVGDKPFLTLLDSNAGFARSRIQGVGGEISFQPESFVNGSDGNAYARVANNGNFSVKTLTIRGGADLAEPFRMSDEIEKGFVVVIDEEHPGHLKRSTTAYDTRVAGIISGANGVNPGISLHQEGVLEGGQNVALSGRVYVNANASAGSIAPGDLLTTSDVPGEAMKAAEHERAQGSILGKAMTSLEEGTGLVLVLVTLQ